jgi:hypothetical protein
MGNPVVILTGSRTMSALVASIIMKEIYFSCLHNSVKDSKANLNCLVCV